LAAKQLLLVIDNFEHVLAAAPFIGGLLAGCPALTVLATSREPLSVHAEERYRVLPLALPGRETAADADALAGVDAVELFCARARSREPDFGLDDANAAAVAEICRRVDGLPLAIELAAARCGLLSPAEIAERLGTTFGALGAGARDAPARQQTLQATITWSHELLDDAEKVGFSQFAVFMGGATVDAAEAITDASADTLDRLVGKSLLVRQPDRDKGTRLLMLELIRAYAGDRLSAAANADEVRECHFRYYLALAQRHGAARALAGTDRERHLGKLDADIDNIHAALEWALERRHGRDSLAVCAALGWYWRMRDRHQQAVDAIDRALRLPDSDDERDLRVRALYLRGVSLWPLGRVAEGTATIIEAERAARALADPAILSHVLQARAGDEIGAGRLGVANVVADEAGYWASAAGDEWETARASYRKAVAATSVAELRERVDRAALLLKQVGNLYELAILLADASYSALCLGSADEAMKFVSRAAPLTRQFGDRRASLLLCGNHGMAALLSGDISVAREAFREELALCRELVVLPMASEGLLGLAAIAAVDGDLDRAGQLVGAASAHRYGQAEDPVDARLQAAFFDPARSRFGASSWEAAARAGAALSLEHAIALALQESPA
jgi:predicted ATPase